MGRLWPRLLAQTFRVLVLAAVVHAEDEGLEDEGDDDGHHHLAGRREREGVRELLQDPPPAELGQMLTPVPAPRPSVAAHQAGAAGDSEC